jgi:FkbM family methyltransferase
MSLTSLARKLQGLDRLLPLRFRLPLRYRVQSLIGALEPEIALLPELLQDRRGRVALDVGANVGIYAYALARLGMRVHAFEPQPYCCTVVDAWAKAKGDVTVHNSGVGESEGDLTLHIPIVDGTPVPTRASFQRLEQEQTQLRVPVVTLDGIGISDVAFIKIDVEGFELQVLRGANRLLQEWRPILLVEIDRTRLEHSAFDELFLLLSGHGYRSHLYIDGRLQPCGENPWNAPPEYYNFIFLASEA